MVTHLRHLYFFLLIVPIAFSTYANDEECLETLLKYVPIASEYTKEFNALVDSSKQPSAGVIPGRTDRLPLYDHYPLLASTVPSVTLTTLPTPVHNAEHASQILGISLYVKRDDLTDSE